MKKIILSLLAFYCCCLSAQEYATGGRYSAEKHHNTPFVNLEALRNSMTGSPRSSEHYLPCPSAGNQGNQGSCSGWAVGYGAMSILAYNKYWQNWDLATMSPSFIYNQVYIEHCDSGAYLVDALELARIKGCCKLKEMPYNEENCGILPNSFLQQRALSNRISYGQINHTSVEDIRLALSLNIPVVVGIFTNQEFSNMWYSNAIWTQNTPGGDSYHFCCIVGYNDHTQLFRVLNSWGRQHGDNGYFWVSYNLVENGVFNEGYAVYAMEPEIEVYISGPDSLCHSAQYYVENVPDSARVIWFRTGIQHFDPDWLDLIDSTNLALPISKLRLNNYWADTVNVVPGKNLGYAPDGSYGLIPYSGPAELTPQVTYNGQTINLSKEIYVKEQQYPEITAHISEFIEWDEAPEHLMLGVRYHFTSELFPDEEDLEWTIITYGDTITGTGIESPVIRAGHDSVFVKVFNPNTDECINLSAKIYTTMQWIGMEFANPVNDIVDIQVAHKLPTNTMARSVHEKELISYEGEFEVELWDMYRGKLRTVTGKNGYVQMPLHSVAVGNYMLRLIIDGQQVDNKPLMVR